MKATIMHNLYNKLKAEELFLFWMGWVLFVAFLGFTVLGANSSFAAFSTSGWRTSAWLSFSMALYFWTIGLYLCHIPGHTIKIFIRLMVIVSMTGEIVLLTSLNTLNNYDLLSPWVMVLIYLNALALLLLIIMVMQGKTKELSVNIQTAIGISLFIFVIGTIFSGGFVNHVTLKATLGIPDFMALHVIQIIPVMAIFFESKAQSNAIAFTVITGVFYMIYVSYAMMFQGTWSSDFAF